MPLGKPKRLRKIKLSRDSRVKAIKLSKSSRRTLLSFIVIAIILVALVYPVFEWAWKIRLTLEEELSLRIDMDHQILEFAYGVIDNETGSSWESNGHLPCYWKDRGSFRSLLNPPIPVWKFFDTHQREIMTYLSNIGVDYGALLRGEDKPGWVPNDISFHRSSAEARDLATWIVVKHYSRRIAKAKGLSRPV